MNKRYFSDRDICTKYIMPAVVNAGWDIEWQICEKVGFTKGRIIVRGKLDTRPVGRCMQQAIKHATPFDIPSVFCPNSDRFLFHDRKGRAAKPKLNGG